MICLSQGFCDTSLSVWEASCILRNFEQRMGKTVSREDLDAGVLKEQFTDKDYALKDSVSHFLSYLRLLLLSFLLILTKSQISRFWQFGHQFSFWIRGTVRTRPHDFELSLTSVIFAEWAPSTGLYEGAPLFISFDVSPSFLAGQMTQKSDY